MKKKRTYIGALSTNHGAWSRLDVKSVKLEQISIQRWIICDILYNIYIESSSSFSDFPAGVCNHSYPHHTTFKKNECSDTPPYHGKSLSQVFHCSIPLSHSSDFLKDRYIFIFSSFCLLIMVPVGYLSSVDKIVPYVLARVSNYSYEQYRHGLPSFILNDYLSSWWQNDNFPSGF